MFKRCIGILLSVIMIFTSLGNVFYAYADSQIYSDVKAVEIKVYSGTCGRNVVWELNDGVLTISGNGAMENYKNESLFPWYNFRGAIKEIKIEDGVTNIGNRAFIYCSSLTSVIIPESVTTIGDEAFYDCSSLTSVIIPESVTTIGRYAFSDCSSLTSVIIPESVTTISYRAFYGCSSLTSVTIPESVTTIGNEAFYGCSSLTSVIIPESVTTIGDSAFYGCSSLTSVIIPESVTTIGDYAFYRCNSLTSVIIPESVTTIGDSAFYGCSSLTSVTIPGSVTTIGDYAFDGCSSLTSVIISESVTTIGDSAFYGCSSLTSVIIPESVTTIGDSAFSGCSSLASVIIPESVTTIGYFAFSDCSSLTSVIIPESVTTIPYRAFYGCSSLTSVIIPESVTTISYRAFYGCSSLTTVTIPKSVTKIGDEAFYSCSSLYKVLMESAKAPEISRYSFGNCRSDLNILVPWDSVEYNLYSWKDYVIRESEVDESGNQWIKCGANAGYRIDNETLIVSGTGEMYNYGYESAPWYDLRESIKEIKIEDGITNIGSEAFSGFSSLTSVTIPESVTTISYRAFYGCSSLTSVIIPESVTTIGYSAFSGCSSLASVIIPESVTTIGDCAFYVCKSLTSVIIPESVTTIGNMAFYGCNSLYEVLMESTKAPEISSYSFGGRSDLNILVPVYSVGYDLSVWMTYRILEFEVDESGNQWIKCGANVRYRIDNETLIVSGTGEMYNYGNEYAPWYNLRKSIKKIKIEDGITNIGSRAFYGCSSLTSVIIPESVTTIGDYAFYGCRSLTSVIIPESVTAIGKYAFYGCSSLTSIIIPESVTKIGEYTFNDCSSLTSVIIPESVTKIGDYAFYGCSNLLKVIIKSTIAPKLSVSSFANGTNIIVAQGARGYTGFYWNCYKILHKYDTPVITTANTSKGQIELTITGNSGVTYEIYRADSSNAAYTKITTLSASLSYIDETAEIGKTYYYKVKAVSTIYEELNSDFSNTVNGIYQTIPIGTDAIFTTNTDTVRFSGNTRYDTSIKTADALKTALGVEKFGTIIVAYGDDYADALAGSYLAKAKNAPILIVNKSKESEIKQYIDNNLQKDGTVYLLGGTGVVSADFEKSLNKYNVTRLGGKNRFETNMLILEEAEVGSEDILICSAYGYADSLSASAVGKPILLVGNELTVEQKTYLSKLSNRKYYIIGGTGAVSATVEKEVKKYGTVKRVYGADRYETSSEVAKEFFKNGSEAVVLAYGLDFPDGLSGGPLAMAMGVPLLLASTVSTDYAADYVKTANASKAVVLGGTALISDKAINGILR